MMRMTGLAATVVLLLSAPAFAQTAHPSGPPVSGAQVISPAVPVVPGSMYNGNNVNPPKLALEGPLAPATLALEPQASFAPPHAAASRQPPNANLGGSSGKSRQGGGG